MLKPRQQIFSAITFLDVVKGITSVQSALQARGGNGLTFLNIAVSSFGIEPLRRAKMRKAIAVAVICLAASLATAAGGVHPLEVKTGASQTTETITRPWPTPPHARLSETGQPHKQQSRT